MTEQPEREPSAVERNAPRVEQLARWLLNHWPQTRKGKAQLVAVVGVTVVGFGLGALTSHGPAAKPVSVTHSNRPAAVRKATTAPTPTVTASSWTPGPAPGYGFVGGNPGDTGSVTGPNSAPASASPTPAPTVQPEPSQTTITPGPAPDPTPTSSSPE